MEAKYCDRCGKMIGLTYEPVYYISIDVHNTSGLTPRSLKVQKWEICRECADIFSEHVNPFYELDYELRLPHEAIKGKIESQ